MRTVFSHLTRGVIGSEVRGQPKNPGRRINPCGLRRHQVFPLTTGADRLPDVIRLNREILWVVTLDRFDLASGQPINEGTQEAIFVIGAVKGTIDQTDAGDSDGFLLLKILLIKKTNRKVI